MYIDVVNGKFLLLKYANKFNLKSSIFKVQNKFSLVLLNEYAFSPIIFIFYIFYLMLDFFYITYMYIRVITGKLTHQQKTLLNINIFVLHLKLKPS